MTAAFPHSLDRRVGKGKNYALSDRDTADVLGHGTALAGLILDTAPDAVLVPLVYCTKTAAGKYVQCSVGTVAQIIRDAVDVYDCQVINISAGVAQDITALREAIAYAEEQGVVVVAAVGNTNRTTPDLCYYPASYDTVIGVGAFVRMARLLPSPSVMVYLWLHPVTHLKSLTCRGRQLLPPVPLMPRPRLQVLLLLSLLSILNLLRPRYGSSCLTEQRIWARLGLMQTAAMVLCRLKTSIVHKPAKFIKDFFSVANPCNKHQI